MECSHQLVEDDCYLTIARDLTARRFAERRLLESEERFRVSFENAPIGKALIGLDGRYLQVNQAFSRITGYGAEQARALTLADVTHPDDLAADLAGMERLLAGEVDTYSLEKRYLTASGEEIWAAKSASLVRGHDRRPLYFIGQIQDITERKQQEQLLREERRRLRESQFVGRIGSWELDLDNEPGHQVRWPAGVGRVGPGDGRRRPGWRAGARAPAGPRAGPGRNAGVHADR